MFFFRYFWWCQGTVTPLRWMDGRVPQASPRTHRHTSEFGKHLSVLRGVLGGSLLQQPPPDRTSPDPSHSKWMCQKPTLCPAQDGWLVQDWTCALIRASEIQGVSWEVPGKSFPAPLGKIQKQHMVFLLDGTVHEWAAEFLLSLPPSQPRRSWIQRRAGPRSRGHPGASPGPAFPVPWVKTDPACFYFF